MSIENVELEYQGSALQISVRLRRGSNGQPWLILLHGLQSNQELFGEFFESSALDAYSMLSVDLVGFGNSSKPESFSYDLLDQARILLRLTEALGIQRMLIIGHSLGGMIATLALRENDARIAAIVSMEGNLQFEDCGKSLEVAALSFDAFENQYPSMVKGMRREAGSGSKRAVWMEQTADYAFHRTANSIVKWSKSGELFTIFSSHPCPKLLVTGAKSNYKSVPLGDSVQIKEISSGGHFMLLDASNETISLIGDFISSI